MAQQYLAYSLAAASLPDRLRAGVLVIILLMRAASYRPFRTDCDGRRRRRAVDTRFPPHKGPALTGRGSGREPPNKSALLEVAGRITPLRLGTSVAGRELERRAEFDHRPDRAQRIWQDDAVQRHHRLLRADSGHIGSTATTSRRPSRRCSTGTACPGVPAGAGVRRLTVGKPGGGGGFSVARLFGSRGGPARPGARRRTAREFGLSHVATSSVELSYGHGNCWSSRPC